MKTKKTPYQRIMKAAKSGVGVRLSAEECHALSLDDAIETRAALDDECGGDLSIEAQENVERLRLEREKYHA